MTTPPRGFRFREKRNGGVFFRVNDGMLQYKDRVTGEWTSIARPYSASERRIFIELLPTPLEPIDPPLPAQTPAWHELRTFIEKEFYLDYDLTPSQEEATDFIDRIYAIVAKDFGSSVTMGVGSGDTGLFVYGTYEAIKVLQAKLIGRVETAALAEQLLKDEGWAELRIQATDEIRQTFVDMLEKRKILVSPRAKE